MRVFIFFGDFVMVVRIFWGNFLEDERFLVSWIRLVEIFRDFMFLSKNKYLLVCIIEVLWVFIM